MARRVSLVRAYLGIAFGALRSSAAADASHQVPKTSAWRRKKPSGIGGRAGGDGGSGGDASALSEM